MKLTWLDKNGNPVSWRIPANLQPYVEAIGIDGAACLFYQCGGAPAYLSKNPHKKSSRLVDAIGRDNVAKLAEVMPWHAPRVPVAREFLIRYFAGKGKSRLEIARLMRVSDVTVRKYLQDPAILEQKRSKSLRQLRDSIDETLEPHEDDK